MSKDVAERIGSDAYNDEPVYFCVHCLSLAIKETPIGDCCCDCGSTAIGKTSLEKYDDLHLAKYGKKVFYK